MNTGGIARELLAGSDWYMQAMSVVNRSEILELPSFFSFSKTPAAIGNECCCTIDHAQSGHISFPGIPVMTCETGPAFATLCACNSLQQSCCNRAFVFISLQRLVVYLRVSASSSWSREFEIRATTALCNSAEPRVSCEIESPNQLRATLQLPIPFRGNQLHFESGS